MLPLTPRAYIFLTIFFNSLISSLICDLVYTTGLPSSDDSISILSESLCWLTISQASLPYSSLPITFLHSAFAIFFFPFIFFVKHHAGIEPASQVWKTYVIAIRPMVHYSIRDDYASGTFIGVRRTRTSDLLFLRNRYSPN